MLGASEEVGRGAPGAAGVTWQPHSPEAAVLRSSGRLCVQ